MSRPSVPPLDGIRAYVVAGAVALAQMCIFGAYAAYPTFLEALQADPDLHHPSLTTLAIPQSVVLGMIPTIGVVAGVACDKYGPRPALFAAALLLMSMGLLTPFAHSIEAFIIVYALTTGTAIACIVAPGPAALGTWFSEERVSIGMGIGEAGSALGTSVMPVVASALVDYYGGWRVPFRIMAVFSIIPLVCCFIIQNRAAPAEEEDGSALADQLTSGVSDVDGEVEKSTTPHGADLDGPAAGGNTSLKECVQTRACASLVLGQLLFAYGYFSLLYITIPFATSFGELGTAYAHYDLITLQSASLLLTCFGIANAIGAVAMGFLSAKINTLAVFSGSMLILGIIMVVLPFCTAYYQLCLAFVVMGWLCAAGLACLPSMVVERFMGPHLNTMMSLSFVGFGLGGLCGPPISSALQSSNGSFTTSIIVAAVSELLAMVVVLLGHYPKRHNTSITTGSSSSGYTTTAPQDEVAPLYGATK